MSGFIAGFLVALTLIVGITLIPVILFVFLVLGIWAYLKWKREQKRREELLRRYFDYWEE